MALAGTDSGTVSAPGISCPGTCSTTATHGTGIALTATPSARSSFAGWSGGGCSGTGTCTVTLSASVTVTATFTGSPPPRPAAPTCILKMDSTTVAATKRPRRAKGQAHGKLTVLVTCSQSATATLTARLSVEPRHKTRTKSFKSNAVHESLSGGKATALTITLPAAAFTDLEHRASESALLTLTATNTSGTSHSSLTLRRLRVRRYQEVQHP